MQQYEHQIALTQDESDVTSSTALSTTCVKRSSVTTNTKLAEHIWTQQDATFYICSSSKLRIKMHNYHLIMSFHKFNEVKYTYLT